jgi:hypothetical protein
MEDDGDNGHRTIATTTMAMIIPEYIDEAVGGTGAKAFAPAEGRRGIVQYETGESILVIIFPIVFPVLRGGGRSCPGAQRGLWLAAPYKKWRNHSLSRHPPSKPCTPPSRACCGRWVSPVVEQNKTKHGKFIRRHSCLPSLFRDVLWHPSAHVRVRQSSELLNFLRVIDHDLRAFPDGPYLYSTCFTLAKVHILPTMERIVSVLPKYCNSWIPGSLRDLHQWYGAIMDRPAVCTATSNRGAKSPLTYCYEETARDGYLP